MMLRPTANLSKLVRIEGVHESPRDVPRWHGERMTSISVVCRRTRFSRGVMKVVIIGVVGGRLRNESNRGESRF